MRVFISYSHEDRFFAELLEKMLAEHQIEVWRDTRSLLAGEEWRPAIDTGIAESFAVVFVMSPSSYESHYVTYEWASAMGQGKPIIPLLIKDCKRHPKIEPIQYIDFRNHGDEIWKVLANRLNDAACNAETSQTQEDDSFGTLGGALSDKDEAARNEIKAYLLERGFRMVSFDRIRKNINPDYTDDFLYKLRRSAPEFRPALLKGGKRGIALR